MQKIYIKSGLPGSNPLANALIIVIGAIVIGITLVLGFFAFLALSAAVLVVAAVVTIRSWWLARKAPPAANPQPSAEGDLIEGEFHVVNKDKNS